MYYGHPTLCTQVRSGCRMRVLDHRRKGSGSLVATNAVLVDRAVRVLAFLRFTVLTFRHEREAD